MNYFDNVLLGHNNRDRCGHVGVIGLKIDLLKKQLSSFEEEKMF